MNNGTNNLTLADVKKLTEESSPETRTELAAKIAMDYRLGQFTPKESAIANDIFRVLLKDIEATLRQALALQLADCPEAPHDIILKLAQDEPDIAEQVLQYSRVLTEEDLLAIIDSTKEAVKLRAIARRDHVPVKVSGKLIAKRDAFVLRDLFSNQGAEIAEKDLAEAWDHISSHPSLLKTLVQRGNLPLTVAEKLFFAVSDELKRQLSVRYNLAMPIAQKAAGDAREWELLNLLTAQNSGNDARIEAMVNELHAGERLSYSLLVRALCKGNLAVFEAGIAKLANVPRINARLLLMDSGGKGFDAIYKAAHMPEGFLAALKTLLFLSFQETDYGSIHRMDFKKRLIERIYTGGYNRTVENMDYFLSIIGGKLAAAASA